MNKTIAFLAWDFFLKLLPYNAELLKGNALLVRAYGASPQDGSIVRSKEFLLFGNGFATLVTLDNTLPQGGMLGYNVEIIPRIDKRQIEFWEIHVSKSQTIKADWELKASKYNPDNDEGRQTKVLVSIEGQPGQCIYLEGPVI